MSWPPVAADLYIHGAPQSYFSTTPAISAGTISAAIEAAFGEMATALSPRAGGDPAAWTWTTTAGQAQATRDVCLVAAADLAESQGLVLPGEGSDPSWIKKAQAVREKWTRMGTPGTRPAAPLYAGLVDATSDVTEGAPRGWSSALPYAETEATA